MLLLTTVPAITRTAPYTPWVPGTHGSASAAKFTGRRTDRAGTGVTPEVAAGGAGSVCRGAVLGGYEPAKGAVPRRTFGQYGRAAPASSLARRASAAAPHRSVRSGATAAAYCAPRRCAERPAKAVSFPGGLKQASLNERIDQFVGGAIDAERGGAPRTPSVADSRSPAWTACWPLPRFERIRHPVYPIPSTGLRG